MSFRRWLTESRRAAYRKIQDVPPDEVAIASDWLEEMKGWGQHSQINLGELAHLVPFTLGNGGQLPAVMPLSQRFPHVVVRRAAGGGPKNIQTAYYFPRQLLLDLCQFLHVSPASSVGSRYEVTAADLFNMIPPEAMRAAAEEVLRAGQHQLFGSPLIGRNRAMRARFRRAGLVPRLEAVLKAVLPNHQLSGYGGTVYHQNALIRVLGRAAEWVEARYGVRPDPAEIIEAA